MKRETEIEETWREREGMRDYISFLERVPLSRKGLERDGAETHFFVGIRLNGARSFRTVQLNEIGYFVETFNGASCAEHLLPLSFFSITAFPSNPSQRLVSNQSRCVIRTTGRTAVL